MKLAHISWNPYLSEVIFCEGKTLDLRKAKRQTVPSNLENLVVLDSFLSSYRVKRKAKIIIDPKVPQPILNYVQNYLQGYPVKITHNS